MDALRRIATLYSDCRTPERATQDTAFTAAVRELLKEADAKPWYVRIWWRFLGGGWPSIDRKYIFEFTEMGDLDGTLGCCSSLGIDKQRVRAIHALIYND